MVLKFARIGPVPAAILGAAVAAAFLALPLRAQEAGDVAAGEPEAAADTAGQAPAEGEGEATPENAGAEPAPENAGAAPAGTAAGETAPGADAAGGEVVVDIAEGSVLDDQTFEGEDDDFIPSEEIPIDQPIPFPTDI